MKNLGWILGCTLFFGTLGATTGEVLLMAWVRIWQPVGGDAWLMMWVLAQFAGLIPSLACGAVVGALALTRISNLFLLPAAFAIGFAAELIWLFIWLGVSFRHLSGFLDETVMFLGSIGAFCSLQLTAVTLLWRKRARRPCSHGQRPVSSATRSTNL